MALARLHTWAANEVLTASDLNGEFNNILNNATALITPFTSNVSLGGFALTSLGLGSASSPSLSFTGDANTGLFSPGADQVSLSAGGATAFSLVSRTTGTAYLELARSSAVGERYFPPIAFGGPDDGVLSITTGTIDLVAGGRRVLSASAYADATNYLRITPSQSGRPVVLDVAGADTNAGLNVLTKGTGTLTLGSAETASVTAATGFVPVTLGPNPPAQHALYTQNTPKAWVNFTGRDSNGAAVINSAFNVESVSRSAQGRYLIIYRRAFVAASNYAITGTGFVAGSIAVVMGHSTAPTAAQAEVQFFLSNTAASIDPHEAMVTIMGNQ